MTAYFSHSTSSTIDGKEDSRALCPLKTLPAMSIRYSVVKVTPDLYTNLCWYPALRLESPLRDQFATSFRRFSLKP